MEEFDLSTLPPELRWATNPEQLRFHRLIEERHLNEDTTQDVKLACGHVLCFIIPLPNDREYSYCSMCLNNWITAQRESGNGNAANAMLSAAASHEPVDEEYQQEIEDAAL